MKRYLIMLVFVVLGLFAWKVDAQELACVTPPSGGTCIMSEPFQSTSYTRGQFEDSVNATAALFVGNQSGSKIGLCNHPFGGPCSIGIQADAGAGGHVFATTLKIADNTTDPGILALLPARNTTLVARFLRPLSNNMANTPRFGYSPINLATGCGGSPCKRIALRWYSYYSSPAYDFGQVGACSNGKIAHSSAAAWGDPPIFTYQTLGSSLNHYSFLDGVWGWQWGGHSGFDGFIGTSVKRGADFATSNWLGKWYRHEIVVRRPRLADSSTLGYAFQYFTKNVTDDAAEVEATWFDSGGSCSGCIHGGDAPDGETFTWNTGTRPIVDMPSLHTEFYRAGTCVGWQGWLYAMVAGWSTDGSQRIGAATEVEGGAGIPSPTAPCCLLGCNTPGCTPANLGLGGLVVLGLIWWAHRRRRKVQR